jgi:hypothetical protein
MPEFVGGPMGQRFAPDVVWLTDQETPDDPKKMGLQTNVGTIAGLQVRTLDKLAVRITIEVPSAKLWLPWARRKRIHPLWLEQLTRECEPDHWWIVTRQIQESEWIAVDERRGGTW